MPSVATRPRSTATSSAGAPVRSRITCQRTDGSESSSHSITTLFGFKAGRLGGLVVISQSSLLQAYLLKNPKWNRKDAKNVKKIRIKNSSGKVKIPKPTVKIFVS